MAGGSLFGLLKVIWIAEVSCCLLVVLGIDGSAGEEPGQHCTLEKSDRLKGKRADPWVRSL